MQRADPSTAPKTASRLPFLELLRAIASQILVWHHLAFYGPLSDVAQPLAPAFISALSEHGRNVVQIFFVMGGMLTARGFTRGGQPHVPSIAGAIWHRYKRSALPYLATLVVAIAANALADRWMDHHSISAPPTLPQLLAHALFLQDVLQFEALTAGIWYLAVDFQLVILSALVFWLAPHIARFTARVDAFTVAQLLLWPLALAALFGFNRLAHLDVWAIYFFGSYFLGMLVEWTLAGRLRPAFFALYLALVAAACVIDLRPRLVVASATALVIFVAGRTGALQRWPKSGLVAYLGRISYSLFLIHFPVCLVVNAFVSSRWPESQWMAVAGMCLAYGLSLVAAIAFHHGVEARFAAPRKPEPALVPASEA